MIPTIILLIENSRTWGRGLISGIAKYAHLNGPWSFYKQQPFFMSPQKGKRLVEELSKVRASGMIMREVPNTQELLSIGLPTIISPLGHKKIRGAVTIIGKDKAFGEMAAEHLLEKGFKQFAYCGLDDMFWSQDRYKGYCRKISEAGFNTYQYRQPESKTKKIWKNEQSILTDWLRTLPKPIGLMCCADERSEQVAELCKKSNIHVPEEIAIIGVDNDTLICELSTPPLSSIALNAEITGYKAAELLDKMMKGKKVSREQVITHPVYVAQRQSTNIFAIDDHSVAEALSFIRNNTKKRINVNDVACAVAMPRRTLERRFREILDKSVYQEIQNERIKVVCHMLIATNISITEIAMALDYACANELTRSFCRLKKMSPLAYRKKYALK